MTSRPRGGLTAALLTLALTASALAGAPAAVAAPPAAAPAAAAISSPLGIERVADADRYSTAVAVSKHAFPSARGGTVFIASGVVYPDALSAAPAARAANAPVLLTRPDALPPVVAAELTRLAPSRIVIVGGPGSVSEAVARALRQHAGQVERLSGASRYDTSTAIAARAFPGTTSAVYIASGAVFADALGASAEAAREGVPILLTEPSRLTAVTEAELRRLRPRTVYVAGGEGTVAPGVLSRVSSVLGTGTIVKRLGGADRYETSALIAGSAQTRQPTTVYLASGVVFPDALAAAPAAAAVGAPVLLTRPSAVPASIMRLITLAGPARVVVVGGEGSVARGVVDELKSYGEARGSLEQVNALRAAVGAPPLRLASQLSTVAFSWSREMAASGYRHNPSVGGQIPRGWTRYGENIAYTTRKGAGSSAFTELWRNSPPHYANMTHPDHTHMGYGQFTDGTGKTFATQVFARYSGGL